MLTDGYHVSDVLMVVGTVCPVGLYFLSLGLVNSHARPFLMSRRADFVVLSLVLAPILLAPAPILVRTGLTWLMPLGGLLAAGLFRAMLPPLRGGFVMYNASEALCRRLLAEALRRLGIEGTWDGRTWQATPGGLQIHLERFAILRNVTIHIEGNPEEADRVFASLAEQVTRRLESVAQLPSPMGACLVLTGLGLMIVPMWLVGRHIHDLVDAMIHLFG